MSNSSTWVTLGLVAISAAASRVSSGSANQSERLSLDYSKAVITGKLWTGLWMVEQLHYEWDAENLTKDGKIGNAILKPPHPNRRHPYHLLAFDVDRFGGIKSRKDVAMDRLEAHINHIFREDLMLNLGLNMSALQSGLIRCYPIQAKEDEVEVFIVISVESDNALAGLIEKVGEMAARSGPKNHEENIDLGDWDEATLLDLRLHPSGVARPSFPFKQISIQRGLGGARHIVHNSR